MQPLSTSLLRAGAARGLGLIISAAAVLAQTAILVADIGPDGYALTAMIVGLTLLLPFLDLGVGAAVTNAVVARERTPVLAKRTLRTAYRTVATTSAVLVLVVGGLSLSGTWDVALALPAESLGNLDLAIFATTVVLGLTIVGSLGYRILLGLGRQDVSALITGLGAPTGLLMLILATGLHLPQAVYPAMILAGTMLASWGATVVALRSLRLPFFSFARDVFLVKSSPGAAVRSLAAPFLVVSLAMPVVLQSHRLFIAHFGHRDDLAEYAFAFQLFLVGYAVISSAGMQLWPYFAERGREIDYRELARLTATFTVAALIVGIISALVADPLAEWITGGQVSVEVATSTAFLTLLVALAAYFPPGMLMTDPRGMRTQAWLAVGSATITIFLAALWTARLGLVGPILAATTAILVFRVLAMNVAVYRLQRRA
jgi:O-antigen/teichoic acid export membrane protein